MSRFLFQFYDVILFIETRLELIIYKFSKDDVFSYSCAFAILFWFLHIIVNNNKEIIILPLKIEWKIKIENRIFNIIFF